MADFEIHPENYFGTSNFALKEALITYQKAEQPDDEMIEFLCEPILANPDEYVLFYPEIIRCLLICLPYDHKLIRSFLPNEEAVEEYLLFKKQIPDVLKLDTGTPYDKYYHGKAKVKMWGDFTDVFVCGEYPETLESLFQCTQEISKDTKGIDHQTAEVYRKLLISVFKLEKFDQLIPILVNAGNFWKFIKIIFEETVKQDPSQELSETASKMFNIVLKNKQYFINPIESLVYNGAFEMVHEMIQYTIDHGKWHMLINIAKKNDFFHCDYIVRIYGDEGTKALWKELINQYQKALSDTQTNEIALLQQVLDFQDKPPKTDKEMEKMIRLPK